MGRKSKSAADGDKHNTSNAGNANQNDFEEDFHEDEGTIIIDDIVMPPPPVQPNLTGDQTGERLIIENIEITNFKSYGGTTVMGPFHKSFNSIVGPNGSGKSNVIDSMLFVFGYRATKLRSAKISNIIHNSDTMPNCKQAEVKVKFAILDDKGRDDHHIIPGSSFSVSRIVEKSNKSWYTINNRTVQFRDVSKKLQQYGIDLRYNRFLILQGEVEQISLMKPKADSAHDTGMLEFLEDIVGTSRYKDPIERLHAKYIELNEERTRFVNQTNLVKRELDIITEAKDEAMKALQLSNRIKIEKSKLVQLQMYKVSRSLQKYEDEYAVEKEKLDELDRTLKEAEERKQKLDAEYKGKMKDAAAAKKIADELKAKFQEIECNFDFMNKKMKTINTKVKALKKQIESNTEKVTELRSVWEAAQDTAEAEALEASRAEAQEALACNEEEMKSVTTVVQQECADLIKQRDELDRALMQFKSEQSDKLNAMNAAHNQVSVLKESADSARSKFEQLTSKLKKVTDETETKRVAIERFRHEIPESERRYAEVGENLATLERRHAELTERMHARNEELQQMKRDAHKAQSRDQVRNALMDQVAKGNLRGIFGRLGALGGIDKKYDIAVSTACGRLNNFVVDTMENAVNAIKYLKANNLATATFIALDKLPRWTADYETDRHFPEDIPRLFDLVRVNDQRFLPAFYFSLQNTLVADDIDQAHRIAYGEPRYRVVTLSGEMIEVDGSMSGGGKPRRGLMGTSVTESAAVDRSQIGVLEQEVEGMRAEREQLHYQIDSVRKDVVQLEADLRVMREKLTAFELEVADNAKRMDQFRDNLRVQKEELARIEANPELERAEAEYAKRKAIYEKEEAKMVAQQEQLDEYDAQITEKLNERLEPIKEAKKALEKKLKETGARLNSLATERRSTELNLKKAEQALEAAVKERDSLLEEKAKLEADCKEAEKVGSETTDKYQAELERQEALEAEAKQIEGELRATMEITKGSTSRRLDLEHEVQKKFKVLDEKRKRAGCFQAELDALVLDKIENVDSDDEEDDESEGDEEEEGEGDEEEAEEGGGEKQQESQDGEPMEVDQQQAADGESIQVDPAGEQATSHGDKSQSTESVEQPSPAKKSKKSRRRKVEREEPTIPKLTPEELAELNPPAIDKAIDRMETELKTLSPNYASIEQYRAKKVEYREKAAELSVITERRDTYMGHLKDTKARRQSEFQTGFFAIARKLKELYRTITLGGDADLEFIDSLDPFSEGINFAVRPNKKSWKNNINLSGGEKTLASLALIFALHYYKPSPLYIMDEIDAALDFKNVSIIANYIKARTRNTQFLIISLRNNMYELAEMLIGVYKTYNVSKTIAFDPIGFENNMKHGGVGTLNSSQNSTVNTNKKSNHNGGGATTGVSGSTFGFGSSTPGSQQMPNTTDSQNARLFEESQNPFVDEQQQPPTTSSSSQVNSATNCAPITTLITPANQNESRAASMDMSHQEDQVQMNGHQQNEEDDMDDTIENSYHEEPFHSDPDDILDGYV